MRTSLCVGLAFLCFVSISTAAMAKGKSQQQTFRNSEHEIESNQQQPTIICQPITSTTQAQTLIRQQSTATFQQGNRLQRENAGSLQPSDLLISMPIRSNKGGLLRGQARAQQVHQMNNFAKNQRHARGPLVQQGECIQPQSRP